MAWGRPNPEERHGMWRLVAAIALVLATALVWFGAQPEPDPGREAGITVRSLEPKTLEH